MSFRPAVYLFAVTSSQALLWALLWVARTSQGVAAASALPPVVPALVGLLFVGATYPLGRALAPCAKLPVFATALTLNAALAAFAPTPLPFLLAPAVAVAAGELYRALGTRAPMLAAMTVYVVCTLLANFTFDSFLALPLYGQLSVGTLFFGVTFTQRDRVHAFGKRSAYAMIAAAALTNLALSALLDIPLRFLLAGFLAILIAEAADTEVYARLLGRRWLVRVLSSNAVSIPLDSAIFTAVAFAGTLSAAVMAEIVFADVLAKTAVGLLAAARLGRRRSARWETVAAP